MAISESIVGDNFNNDLKPFVKYFRLMIMTGRVRRNWVKAKGMGFSMGFRNAGIVNPHILPIDI